MEHIFDGTFPDPKRVLANWRQIGLMYMGLSYAMFLMLFFMAYESPAEFWDPVVICLLSLTLGIAVAFTALLIRHWNNEGSGACWGLRLTFDEADHWIHGGRLDRDIGDALGRTGSHFEKELIPHRYDIKTWGPVHRYVSHDGPFVEWYRLTQSSISGRHDMYVMMIGMGNITSETIEFGRRVYTVIDNLELLQEARHRQEW